MASYPVALRAVTRGEQLMKSIAYQAFRDGRSQDARRGANLGNLRWVVEVVERRTALPGLTALFLLEARYDLNEASTAVEAVPRFSKEQGRLRPSCLDL
jgi:hypothetical protein